MTDFRPDVAGFWICRTCAVEHDQQVEVCAICADERQWVPAAGQQWMTLDQMRHEGFRSEVRDLEPGLIGVTSNPRAGIGQQAKVVSTAQGSLLWDPIGFIDDVAVRQILEQGPVAAIASSHPHMFGVQLEWSRALGGVPVLVAEPDMGWLARKDSAIKAWSGTFEPLPGVKLIQVGGHFKGSSVVHWPAGANGLGVLLAGDTISANPDRTSVSFMRSYPNHIPLSAAVVERIDRQVQDLNFGRLYSNFENVIEDDARAVVHRSAVRHIQWVRGDFDDLT